MIQPEIPIMNVFQDIFLIFFLNAYVINLYIGTTFYTTIINYVKPIQQFLTIWIVAYFLIINMEEKE